MTAAPLALFALLVTASMDGQPPTGIIVDASLLDLQRCRFPRLFDPADEVVYPPPKLAANPDYLQGFCGFKLTLSQARADTRKVGDRPLIIRPERLFADDPLCGSMVVSQESATLLNQLNQAHGLLDQDRLVIVMGLAVAAVDPPSGAAQVPWDQVIAITLSQRLKAASANRAGAVKVSCADGEEAAVTVLYVAAERLLRVTPTTPWAAGRTYRVVVTKGLTAESGAELEADETFTFTVVAPAGSGEPPAADSKGDSAPAGPPA